MTVLNPRPVHELLDGLGRTVDMVERTLLAAGVKGKMNSDVSCPIARYLNQNGYPEASVSRRWVLPCSETHATWVDTTEAVYGFVAAFDMGRVDVRLYEASR